MGGFSCAPRCPAFLTFRDSPALLRQESDGYPVRRQLGSPVAVVGQVVVMSSSGEGRPLIEMVDILKRQLGVSDVSAGLCERRERENRQQCVGPGALAIVCEERAGVRADRIGHRPSHRQWSPRNIVQSAVPRSFAAEVHV